MSESFTRARRAAVAAAVLVGAVAVAASSAATSALSAARPASSLSPSAAATGASKSPGGVPSAGGDIQPMSQDAGGSPGYTPVQIRTNYNLGPVYAAGYNGAGRVIGIVDVYGSPTIRADLATFDRHFGIAAPPSFTIIQPAGKVPPFNPSNGEMQGWAGETTLDVEWAHAMAPGAAIVLAETPVDEVEGTSGFAQIMTAENYMILHERVAVISQSFEATEETFPNAASLMNLRGTYMEAEQHGVTILGASGDAGASGSKTNVNEYYDSRVVGWPASDPLVTAVGGTNVTLDSAGHPTAPVQVWDDFGSAPAAGGGGVSEYFARPSWQSGVASVVGKWRGMPDVSMTASCTHPVTIYESIPGGAPGYYGICGTSVATPVFAGIVAIAAQLHGSALGLLNPLLYHLGATHAPGLVDVTQGNNSVEVTVGAKQSKVVGYDAVPGYDLASGWGTINAADLVPELAGHALTALRR